MKPAASTGTAVEPFPVPRRLGNGAGSKHTQISIRQATREDCACIAKLFMIASGGLAEYIWSRFEAPDLSLLEIGERRYAREGTAFSYRNCLVAENDGEIVGMVHGFPMQASKDNGAASEADPVLAPYTELEDYGSLYISAVAVFDEYRGLGIGTRLLEEACRRARALGLKRLSLICFEKNTKAMRLYRRLGFRELQRRPIVPHPFLHYRDGDAVLVACPCDDLNAV